MKAHEMRSLAQEELATRIFTCEADYLRLRCNHAVGQLENTNQVKSLRREIARGKTILNEKNKNGGSEE